MSNLQTFNRTITDSKTQEYLKQVLGNKKESFVNNLTALVANNKQLQECEPLSLMFAAIKATALDLPLDPNLGFAYVIPYNCKEKDKDGKEIWVKKAQFQIGYKGFVQLGMRTGQFETINVRDVREGELIDEDFISGEFIFKKLKDDREEAKTIGFVAYFKLINGFRKALYMTSEEVDRHANRYSQTYSSDKRHIKESSKWTTDFASMAEKTVLKRLLSKYAPLSVQMQEAIRIDQAVVKNENDVEYIDNPTIEISEEDEQKGIDILSEALK